MYKYQELINQLTLEEKASLLSGKNFWETVNVDRLNIPSIFLADGPHGIRKQAAAADHLGLNESLKATCFPTASALSCSWNLDLINEIGKALGREAKGQNVNVLLGPGTNIKRNPLCGRNFEYFSEDPYLAGKLAANYIQGVQYKGISACLKHFACNSQELRRMTCDSVVDERALREIYLTNFEIAIKEGKPLSIMSAYNKLNGKFANENPHLMKEILRDEFGFKGVVVTDWGGENDRVEGLKCDNELEMPSSSGETPKDIVKAVNEGKLDIEVVNKNVDNLLDLVFKTYKTDEVEFDLKDHHELARIASSECMVLLENDGVLPLKAHDKVAFFGQFVKDVRHQGAGSSQVNSFKVESVLDNISNYDFDFVGYEQGYDFKDKKLNKGMLKKAVKLASKADILCVYIGLDNFAEAEGIDRSNMKIPSNQIDFLNELLKLGKKVVVCLTSGSQVELPFAKEVNAMLHMHLGGEAVAISALDILSGKVNPSGKLSETYVNNYEDHATSKYWHQKDMSADYKESIFVGYRYFLTANKEVRYPFGYGKSYTTFEYSNLSLNKSGAKFTIKNTGSVKGKEVAQLYIGKNDSEIFRSKYELKGFVKVELEPGEEKEVEIKFDDYSFRYFNVKTNEFEVEDGKYQIYIGASSTDFRLNDEINVKGTKASDVYNKEEVKSYFECKVNDISDEEFSKILGREVEDGKLKFVRKNRIIVDYQTTVEQLRYSKGWLGRLFSRVIRATIKICKKTGKIETANVLTMGILHQPMRGISRMSNGLITWKRLNGMILIFNGHFFKGLKLFFAKKDR